jgi:TolB protein
MTLRRNRRALALLSASAIAVVAAAAIAPGVADSASPPESGPAVRTHVEHANIYVLDIASGQITRTTHHQGEGALEPSWSADGQIAYSSQDCDECDSVVSEVDPQGTTQVQIDSTVKHVYQPTWSPDGAKVAVVGLGRGIYSVDVQGQTAKRLTSGRSDEAPSWSPKGDEIVFHKQVRDTNYDLFAVDAATGKTRRITNDSKQQTNPAWSPGGSRIAFAEQESDGQWAIYTMTGDGKDRRRVTSPGISAQEPSWSPDGKQIAFVLQELDRATLAVIDVGGGKPKRLTDSSLFVSQPSWSPDGKSIAFAATEPASP